LLLAIEAEAIRAAGRAPVEHVAHPEEKARGGVELLVLPRQQNAEVHQRPYASRAPARQRRPVGDVEIAQPALPALHVGLQQVNRVAEARATLLRLLLDALEEAVDVAAREHRVEGLLEHLRAGGLVASQQAPIEQGRRGGEIFLRE